MGCEPAIRVWGGSGWVTETDYVMLRRFTLSGKRKGWNIHVEGGADPDAIGATTGVVYALAVDSNGDLAFAGLSLSEDVYQWDDSENVAWDYDHAGTIRAVVMDGSDNLYVAGTTGGGSKQVRKFNSSGTLQWSVSLDSSPTTGRSLALDSAGKLYVGTEATPTIAANVFQLEPSTGSVNWSLNANSTAFHVKAAVAIAFDSNDDMYVAHALDSPSGPVPIMKWTYNSGSKPTASSSISTTHQGNALAVDGSDNLYVAGAPDTGTSDELQKFNSSGTLQWGFAHGATLHAVHVDAAGDVWIAGEFDTTDSVDVRRLNSSGVEQSTHNYQDSNGSNPARSILRVSDDRIYVGGNVTPA